MAFPHGQGELTSCGRFADKGEGVNFSRICADVLYGRLLILKKLFSICSKRNFVFLPQQTKFPHYIKVISHLCCDGQGYQRNPSVKTYTNHFTVTQSKYYYNASQVVHISNRIMDPWSTTRVFRRNRQNISRLHLRTWNHCLQSRTPCAPNSKIKNLSFKGTELIFYIASMPFHWRAGALRHGRLLKFAWMYNGKYKNQHTGTRKIDKLDFVPPGSDPFVNSSTKRTIKMQYKHLCYQVVHIIPNLVKQTQKLIKSIIYCNRQHSNFAHLLQLEPSTNDTVFQGKHQRAVSKRYIMQNIPKLA